MCSFIASTNYTVILSWAALYFFESMLPNLPYSIHSQTEAASGTYTYEDYINGAQLHFNGTHLGEL